MEFDKLCGLSERYKPFFLPLLKEAKLFDFPYVPHLVLPKRFAREDVWSAENFFLPFPIMAIEDKASCVLLFDLEPNQIGIETYRGFIECTPATFDLEPFDNRNEDDEIINKKAKSEKYIEMVEKKVSMVSFGNVYIKYINESEFFVGGSIHGIFIADKKMVHNDYVPKSISNEQYAECLKGPGCAIQEVLYFNQPSRFIVEKTIVKNRKKNKNKKLLRSHERPQYTVLHPEKIREIIGGTRSQSGSSGRKSPISHERRRCIRFLSDKKYSKGPDGEKLIQKTIPFGPRKGEMYYRHSIVSSTWIGPSEAVVKNKRYRVLLDT